MRLMGVNYVETFVNEDGWEEILSALVGCLGDNNAKVTQGSLQVIAKLIRDKTPEQIRGFFTLLWGPLKEKLGDSKIPIREAACSVLLELIEKLGMSSVMDRLVLCATHKNWRIREQVLVCVLMTMQRYKNEPHKLCLDGLLQMTLKLLEDPTKEVREASLNVLEELYKLRGQALVHEIQSKNLRPAHMRMLMSRFNGEPPAMDSRSYAQPPSRPFASLPSSSAPLSPVAKSKRSVSFPPESQPQTQLVTCGMTDREIQQQMTSILDGLAENQEWTTRVKSLQQLQQLIEKKATLSPIFVQALKPIRERICEQVVDLRSTVIREACATISALAQDMADAFHPFVEPILAALFKSVCVTIQVVSVSADTCVQNIIRSTQTGYSKAVPKLIEGTKSKSQVLRFHCVEYLTLAWSIWDPAAFEKYVETMASILPLLICDAQADVRASARRCFWAFHRIHTIRANQVLESLDLSSKRRVLSDTTVPVASAISLPKSSAASPTITQSISQPVGPSRVIESPTMAPLRMGPRRVLTGVENNSQVAKAPIPPRRVPVNTRKRFDAEENYEEYSEVRKSISGPLRVLNPSVYNATSYPDTKPSSLSSLPLRVEVLGKPESARRKITQDDNQSEERVSISHLEKRADNSMWNVRLETVKSLEKAVPGATSQDVSKITKIAVARIHDSHFLVAQSAMKLYHTLLTTHPSMMEDSLKTVLPKVFAKLVDSKEGMRQQAANILETLGNSTYNASTLLQWIVPLMLDVPVKVKLHIYNFISSLLPKASDFCNTPVLLRALVLKLADSIEFDNQTERGTISIVTNVLEKIIDLYGSSFSAILQQLSPSKLTMIQKCVNLQSSNLKRKHERQVAPLPPAIESNNSTPQEIHPIPAKNSNDSLAILWSNNATNQEKCLVMDELIKSRCKVSDGNSVEWTRVLLAVLDLALEHCSEPNRVVNNKVMQTLKVILSNPDSCAFVSAKIDSIIIPIVSRATNSSEFGHYFVEKFLLTTLTIVPTSTCIRLLVALIKSPTQDDMQLQTVLKALHQTISLIPSHQALRVGEYDLMATATIPVLSHSKSVVRKMALMCMVGLYFLDDAKFVPYLQSLAPHVQKLVSLYIEKEQSQRNQR